MIIQIARRSRATSSSSPLARARTYERTNERTDEEKINPSFGVASLARRRRSVTRIRSTRRRARRHSPVPTVIQRSGVSFVVHAYGRARARVGRRAARVATSRDYSGRTPPKSARARDVDVDVAVDDGDSIPRDRRRSRSIDRRRAIDRSIEIDANGRGREWSTDRWDPNVRPTE